MMDTDKLTELAHAACDAAVANGADCADASVGSGSRIFVEAELNAIKSTDARRYGGISVKAVCRGGTGWASSDILTPDGAAEAGRRAAELAKLSEPDPDFVSLPQPAESYPQVQGLADPRLAEIDVKQMIASVLDNIDAALAVCADASVSGGFSGSCSTTALVNSLGVSAARDSSAVSAFIMVVIRNGDDVGSAYDFDLARTLDDFDPAGIGARAAQEALKLMGARKVETGRMSVVLGPLASDSVIGDVVSMVDAEGIQRGRSFMAGKLGEKIASEHLTLTDDPLIPGGVRSRAFDSEGTPCRPMVIVEDGVLKTYIYSSYTAGKAGVQPTGHGTRTGGATRSNVLPKLGRMTSAEIIRNTERGIYVARGGLSPNMSTGDVSSPVDSGFMIENGEITYPVKNAMLGGSFLDMLKNIDAVSSDCREEPGMIMPTVRIQDVTVAGSK